MRIGRKNAGLVFFLVLGLIFFSQSTSIFAVATLGDPVGVPSTANRADPRPATAAEKEILRYFNIPSDMTTDAIIDQIKGGCDTNPFPYLEQRHSGDRSNSFITPKAGSGSTLTQGLDPALACRLKRLLEVMETKGCRVTISSAMRPVQRCNPGGGACAPQGGSCHQYGKAVDLNATPQCLDLLTQMIGRQNPGSAFGLHVAYIENGNYRHVQCVEHLRAGCGPSTPPCRGGMQITADPNYRAPSSSVIDALRSRIAPPPPPPPPPPQQPSISPTTPPSPTSGGTTQPPLSGNNTVPQQVGTCPPQFYCASNNLYYRTSTCVDQMYQACPNGCSGNSCSVSPQQISDLLNNAVPKPTSTRATTTQASTTQSAYDRLGSLFEVGPATATSSGSPFVLTVSGEDAARLAIDSEGRPAVQLPSGSIYSLPPPPAQQTFTSPDLSLQSTYQYRGSQSTLQRALADMIETLERAISYLKPFGYRGSTADQHHLHGE